MTLSDIKNFLGVKYTREVASALGLHTHTVYKWEKEGVPYTWQLRLEKMSRGALKNSFKKEESPVVTATELDIQNLEGNEQ